MNNSNIENRMENLTKPEIEISEHQREFRAAFLNTKKSAIGGALLLLLPLLFLSGVILKHYLNIDFGILTSVYLWISKIDQMYGDRSILNWIIRFLLIFGPLTAIGINLLSILHIRYEKISKEIVLSVKFRWLNWLIIGVCATTFTLFFFYLVLENVR